MERMELSAEEVGVAVGLASVGVAVAMKGVGVAEEEE